MTDDMAQAIARQMDACARSQAVDRRDWTRQQWIDDARRLMDEPDGAVTSLVNGHVMAMLDELATDPTDETRPDREALPDDLSDLVEYYEAHGEDRVTLGRVAWCIRQTMANAALPAPHPQCGTEALRARIEAETHREVDAPAGTDFGYRVGWADGYTAACDAVRALLAAAPAPTEAGPESSA